MRNNPISAKYEPLQAKLVNKVHNLNTRVYNAIKNANVNTTDDLLIFLGTYIMLQFASVRKATTNYLGVVKEDVKQISNNNDLAPNKSIINQMQNQTYIELNSNLVCAEKELMQELRTATKPFKDKPTHITDVKSVLQQEFVKNGGVKVTYKNGARMPLDKYFAMATRTARNETQNATAIDNAIKLGTDYVYMAPNHSSCKTCSAMGNRVYCISGKDPSYPSVYGTLFKRGYTCIHPHCRCMLRPYFIDNHTPNEIKELQESSNRSFDLDERTEQQRQQYQESQAFNHRQWSSQQKFEQMQRVYGKDAPYKTLGGLRRGRTLESQNYKAVNKALVDQNQYNRWLDAIGKENMPTTLAKFQEIKYNNHKEFEQLQHYKDSIKSGMVTPLATYKHYVAIKHQAENTLINLKCGETTTTKLSKHFIDRVIGSVEQKRNGVAISQIKECVTNGIAREIKIDGKGRKSQKFVLQNVCIVSINPDTGELIQVNPTRSKKWNLT